MARPPSRSPPLPELVVMSEEGASGVYVNPHGVVHDMVTVGRVTHGRLAEGACIGDNISLLRTGIDIQNPEDWHHFPC